MGCSGWHGRAPELSWRKRRDEGTAVASAGAGVRKSGLGRLGSRRADGRGRCSAEDAAAAATAVAGLLGELAT
jgi:hypothetical protein